MLANSFLNTTLLNIKDRVDISVTFKTDASEKGILDLKRSLELLPEVKKVDYLSREQELSDFRDRHKDNALLIQSIDEVGNPFGARINIQAIDPSQFETVARFLEGQSGVDSGVSIIDQISFKKDIVDRLLSIIDSTNKVALIISAILIFLSILVTFNTISLAIYTARDEISLMRLVGANNFYISGPFIVEGVISGIISAFVAMIILYPATLWTRSATESIYGGVDLLSPYIDQFGKIFVVLLFSGIVLGVVSSFLAIRKYLKI